MSAARSPGRPRTRSRPPQTAPDAVAPARTAWPVGSGSPDDVASRPVARSRPYDLRRTMTTTSVDAAWIYLGRACRRQGGSKRLDVRLGTLRRYRRGVARLASTDVL